jgi:heme A synthase
MTFTPATIALALVPIIVWRVYKRVRRNIGKQRSRLWRHWAGTVLCPLLLALVALGAMRSLDAEAALAAGIALGIGLGVYGLRLTRFENDGPVFYYTPNPYLGIGLSLLLVGRVLYRFFELYQLHGDLRAFNDPDLGRSPLTLAMIGIVFGYYTAYSLGLLRWRLRSRLPAPV